MWTMMGINLCQKIFWIAYFFRPDPVSAQFEPRVSTLAGLELDKMNDAVSAFWER
jgi:hypothetical protein